MTEGGSLTEEIYSTINTAPDKTMLRAQVLRKFGHKLSAQELLKVMETLVIQQRVKTDTSGDGKLMYKILE
jgi:hypothetical protein